MSQTIRAPQAYRRGGWARVVEGLRYGGGVGQWSWLIHRITGLGILFFLVIHIIDTFLVVAYPALYDHTVAVYAGKIEGLPAAWGVNGYYWPIRYLFRLGELGLIACVLFHSINGVRVVMFDFVPGAVKHQRAIFRVVMAVFLAIMIPVAIWVVLPLRHAPERPSSPGAAGEPTVGSVAPDRGPVADAVSSSR